MNHPLQPCDPQGVRRICIYVCMYICIHAGSRRVPRWLQGALERAPGAMGGPWDGPRTSRGGHERFEPTFSNVFGPSGALVSIFVRRNRPRPSKGQPPLRVKGGGSGPGREPLRRVQGPLFLIQYTCYLILDIRHLILDTCTYT